MGPTCHALCFLGSSVRNQPGTAAEEAPPTVLSSGDSDCLDCACVNHNYVCSTVAVCWEIISEF